MARRSTTKRELIDTGRNEVLAAIREIVRERR